jgi:hypothetical protein
MPGVHVHAWYPCPCPVSMFVYVPLLPVTVHVPVPMSKPPVPMEAIEKALKKTSPQLHYFLNRFPQIRVVIDIVARYMFKVTK